MTSSSDWQISASLVDRGFEQVMDVDVEDAGGVLGPLDVAPDPEEALGDPAQHVAVSVRR